MSVSTSTIKRAIHAGRLQAKTTSRTNPETGLRRGGKTLITGEALDAWFDALEDA